VKDVAKVKATPQGKCQMALSIVDSENPRRYRKSSVCESDWVQWRTCIQSYRYTGIWYL